MALITINGIQQSVPSGITLLHACQRAGIDIPTLCHDERLTPTGGCRLCLVDVVGWERPTAACNTIVAEGMEIQTHSPDLEATRKTLLELLAANYPPAAFEAFPEKPFHQYLKRYGVEAGGKAGSDASHTECFRDTTHPYLHADFSQCITCFRCVRICDEVQGQCVWHAWNRGEATRIRPEEAQTLLESTCVSCGACVDTCPTGALEDQTVLRAGLPAHWTRTTCPYCGVGCEMQVGTRADRIVQVRPALDAPVNQGHLCSKGRYAFQFVHAQDRILHPMIREGKEWRRSTWDEALQMIADRLRQVLEEQGPDAIGVLGSARATNEENFLTQKFARVVLGTNNVDCCARVCHAPTAAGMSHTLGTGAATNSFDDIEKAHTFLVCGCNPTENHPIVGARILQAVRKGAALIVIDPRQIELSRYATVHLQLKPGTNLAVLLAMAHVIVTEGWGHEKTLRERVSQLAEFAQSVADWTPERAASVSGVDASSIREAARLYARQTPSMCFHGLGVTEHSQGTDGVMGLVNLALLTGNFGRPGTGVNPLRGQNNVQGSAHMGCEPAHLTGYIDLEKGRSAFEQLWESPVPHRPGMNLMQMIDAAAEKRLHALWCIGYDIALTNPDAQSTGQALAQLDLVVVQDLFLNETARHFAHVFLPACSSFEKEGTFMNSERRVQRVRAALEPRGESKPDWKIICELAKEMGFAESFAYENAESIWDEVRSLWPAGAGLAYSRLDQGGIQWPCPDIHHPGTSILHTESFPHGPRAPLQPLQFIPTSEIISSEYPFLLSTGRTLQQFNAGTMTGRTDHARLRSTDTLDIHPSDAAQQALRNGDTVRIRSRHGQALATLRLDDRIQPGELFATFHDPNVFLNRLTSAQRDREVQTPEYKVVAVRLESAPALHTSPM